MKKKRAIPNYDRPEKGGQFIIMHSGAVVGLTFGYPTIHDMAVQTMRIVRYNGSLKIWWPVGMHLLHCADLALRLSGTPRDELHCLFHDGPESVFSDVPGPLKCKEHSTNEHALLDRLYDGLQVPLPTPEQTLFVKRVDKLSLIAEAEVLGHPAFAAMVASARHKDQLDAREYALAKVVLQELLVRFNPLQAIDSAGRHVCELRDRMFQGFFQIQRDATTEGLSKIQRDAIQTNKG